MRNFVSCSVLCDCLDFFLTRGLPAGLELHHNVLSAEEQLKMVQTIEEWVIQVSLLAQIPASSKSNDVAWPC